MMTMMNPNLQNEIDSQRYEEMLRYANKYQQAQQLNGEQRNGKSAIYKPALASLGKMLSDVGGQLQERYGNQSNPNIPQTGNYQLETAK